MPADMMEKTSSSPVAATPASMNTTPDKPKTASEHRKVCMKPLLRGFLCLRKRSKNKTFNIIYFLSLVIKANYGKEEKSPNQREFGPAENPHPGCAQKGCKYSLTPVINRFAKFPVSDIEKVSA